MRLVAPSKQQILLGLALALLGAAYLGLLFYRGFSDPDEGRYAEIPREMVATGHWGEMRMLGYRYYEKPPLAYWTIAPAIAVCGAQEWAVRIPLLINGLLLLGLLHLLLRRHWSGAPGRQALLVLATLIGFALGFCLLLTDGFLSFWFSLTCCALFWAFQPLAKPQLKPAFLLLAAAAAALGVLTKGMVALLLPAAIVLLWLAWERRLSALLTKGLPLAAGLFLAILTPAAMWIEQHNPGFIRHFIFEEHIARFLGTRATQLHEEPCWFYAATLVPLLLPWSLFVPRALRNVIKGRHWRHDILTRFFIVWMMVVIVFFSVGTGKLMSYIMPALPPLGLLLGRWGLAEPLDGSRRDRQLWRLGIAGMGVVALLIGLLWAIAYFQLMPQRVYRVAGVSGLALLLLVLGWVIGKRYWNHFSGALWFAAVLLTTIALLLSPLAGKDFNVLLHINSSHVYKRLAALLQPADSVVVFWDYRPALPFYTQRLPHFFQNQNELAYGIQREPERRGYLHDLTALKALLDATPGRVFGVVDPEDYTAKFLPLQLNFSLADCPQDPDTIIVELLRE